MELKLNNSEANFILSLIDDNMSNECFEGNIGEVTMKSIIKKIGDSVRAQPNGCVDEYATMLRNYYIKEAED
ncbi:MAG TPA: hypothetical protein VMV43_00310 [Candidatus Nanopelagicaceae bacterium]|nr:hypothetical protein [Candidatus Nanopelagicaceae bacterium]